MCRLFRKDSKFLVEMTMCINPEDDGRISGGDDHRIAAPCNKLLDGRSRRSIRTRMMILPFTFLQD